ncbi:MAG: hypothetical protein QXJ92_02815 [Candidatus Pacearchaeota archaeon]
MKLKEGNSLVNSLNFGIFLVLLFLLFLILPLASAAINETKQVENAYKWLENATRGKWQGLSVLDHEFALLALSYKAELKGQGLTELKKRGYPVGSPYCYGQATTTTANQCRVKESALAALLYSRLGLEANKLDEWLLNQSSLFTNIYWYLQLDVERGYNASCNVSYVIGGNENVQSITIYENKSVAVSRGDCLGSAGYWVAISKSKDCYEADYKILCEVSESKPYKVGFLYKENPSANVWYVADISYSVESGSFIDVSIKDISRCLADPGGGCDYEANAIAAYALKEQGRDEYKNLLPYLKIMAEANKAANSYAWLYLITQDYGYGKQVLRAMSLQGYWSLSSFGQSYDTAINGYSLIKNSYAEYNSSKTRHYLLNVQNPAGYWQCPGCSAVIRDTAMLLYVFWPKAVAVPIEIAANACETAGGSCEVDKCPAGYVENPELSESCAGAKCCIATSSLSCYDPLIAGQICSGDQQCNGTSITAAEGECCKGTCVAPEETCEQQYGYLCNQENDEYCSPGYEIPATDARPNEGIQCCSIACQSCAEINGNVCTESETCRGEELGKCCIGECVPNKECSELGGEKCEGVGWRCDGNLVKALDTNKCCVGTCIKDCASQGGEICEANEKCEGEKIRASDVRSGESCCVGTCKAKGKGWIVFLIILIILALGGLLFYLVKTGKIKIKKARPAPGAVGGPARPMGPTGLGPGPGPAPMPPITARPLPTFPALPKPIPKEKVEAPKEAQKEALKEEAKPKTRAEEQFAKTIEKIKKLTEKS